MFWFWLLAIANVLLFVASMTVAQLPWSISWVCFCSSQVLFRCQRNSSVDIFRSIWLCASLRRNLSFLSQFHLYVVGNPFGMCGYFWCSVINCRNGLHDTTILLLLFVENRHVICLHYLCGKCYMLISWLAETTVTALYCPISFWSIWHRSNTSHVSVVLWHQFMCATRTEDTGPRCVIPSF